MRASHCIVTLMLLVCNSQTIQAHGTHHHDQEEKPNANWTHSADLKKSVGVDFKWIATDKDSITMEMSSKTSGYVSVGFCPEWHNSMEGCDLVIGWVDDTTRKGHLNDYHAIANDVPIKDPSQDYELISVKQDGWVTTIVFKRKWNTGDENDADLENKKVQLIWSWHPEDVDGNGVIKPHDRNTRGHTKEMISLKSPPEERRVALKQEQEAVAPGGSPIMGCANLLMISVLALFVFREL